MGPMDRRLAALGRHVTYSDGVYWVYAIVVVAIGVTLALVTGLWGLAGIALGAFSLFAVFCRKKYERMSAGSTPP